VDSYARTWIGEGSPLESDAMTLSAFQGVGSLEGALERAQRAGKGVFVLAATSNPEGVASQQATVGSGARAGMTVAAGIVADVVEWNQSQVGPGRGAPGRFGSAGVVLGATLEPSGFGIRLSALTPPPGTPVLAPGFGHQGASLDSLEKTFGVAAPQVIVTASRSIATAGARGVGDEISRHGREVGRWRG
jgi:orotidine-5'-phosphate decarboxylase